ncbi:Rab-GTPase-TBC [Gracilaria domingensis]|nr:Rab-GTPase-TBC [Gracilaria domingensis]
MSHRGHARRILQRYGCDEKITMAAKHATLSGDYTAAAKSTVAAGQLTGRSIDEYGFFVDAEKRPSIPNADDADPHQSQSALSNIAHKMMHEPYTSVDELNGLEQIVSDDAQQNLPHLSSSQPNSASSQLSATDENASAKSDSPAASSERVPSALASMTAAAQPSSLPQPDFDESALASSPADDVSATALEEQPTASGTRRSANFADPDFDKLRMSTDELGATEQQGALADGGRSGSRSGATSTLSPLLVFSSATEQAAKRDAANGQLQKTNSQITRESEHERIWKEVMERRPEMLQRERGRSSRVVAYRELALVPVPPAMRRRLWPILLDTKSLRDSRPGLYDKLCKAGEGDLLPDDIEHTIQADVTRTMPSHSLFWSGGAQVGVQSLRSILRAYARYVPTVGYCQGMSSIAAVFLMNAVDEEEAFLMFAQFMNRFQYKKVFAPGFPLMLQWISELKPLVAHYMPQLNLRLERENVALELYADKWLITALSHNFPHRHLLRVWDLMFLGGSPKIILKACLAVLKQCESRLMKMDFETMMPFLQRGFAEPDAGVLDAKDPEPFVAMMREFRFMRDIPKSQLEASQAVAASAAKPPQPEPQQAPQERKSALCCLPCFKRSATLD